MPFRSGEMIGFLEARGYLVIFELMGGLLYGVVKTSS